MSIKNLNFLPMRTIMASLWLAAGVDNVRCMHRDVLVFRTIQQITVQVVLQDGFAYKINPLF